jgi:hypothetical protein
LEGQALAGRFLVYRLLLKRLLCVFRLIAIMLGRLHMDVDTCITKYCELSSIVFQPKRSKANVIFRLKDLVKVEGKYRSDQLETEVKNMVREIVKTTPSRTCLRPT